MDQDQERALKRALREAYALEVHLRRDSRDPQPKPYQVIFRALQTAMFNISRIPDREKGWLKGFKTAWPGIATTWLENEIMGEIVTHMLAAEIAAGDPVPDPKLGALQASEMSATMAVLEVYPEFMVGPKERRVRDWRIMCLIASGKPGAKRARSIPGAHRQFAAERRTLQCKAIAKKLEGLLPLEAFFQ